MTVSIQEALEGLPHGAIKPGATILDATAGNRMIWRTKESPYILWIDIESELEYNPDLILDCRKTNFPDGYFSTIFFDPPHYWGAKIGTTLTVRNQKEKEEYLPWKKEGFTYYGGDKYRTKTELLAFVHRSQKEFFRILRPDGMLWFKWNDLAISLGKILPLFKNWNMMLKLHTNSPYKNRGENQTFWIMFMKKNDTPRILDLSDFTNIPEREEAQ